mmetsp:Transcript_2060/g.3247  ORF Transcript_2060/g.3247 Transcript_2060/m.3247 type:complete len:238 (-) Transcript_2060:1100-1813(-)
MPKQPSSTKLESATFIPHALFRSSAMTRLVLSRSLQAPVAALDRRTVTVPVLLQPKTAAARFVPRTTRTGPTPLPCNTSLSGSIPNTKISAKLRALRATIQRVLPSRRRTRTVFVRLSMSQMATTSPSLVLSTPRLLSIMALEIVSSIPRAQFHSWSAIRSARSRSWEVMIAKAPTMSFLRLMGPLKACVRFAPKTTRTSPSSSSSNTCRWVWTRSTKTKTMQRVVVEPTQPPPPSL